MSNLYQLSTGNSEHIREQNFLRNHDCQHMAGFIWHVNFTRYDASFTTSFSTAKDYYLIERSQ